MNAGACSECGVNFKAWEFWFDSIGRTHLDHTCDPLAAARFQQDLPRYSQRLPRFGLMACGRCKREIQRRRIDQKWCIACAGIVRKEQDAERWQRKRGAA